MPDNTGMNLSMLYLALQRLLITTKAALSKQHLFYPVHLQSLEMRTYLLAKFLITFLLEKLIQQVVYHQQYRSLSLDRPLDVWRLASSFGKLWECGS